MLYDEQERISKAFSIFFHDNLEFEGITPDALMEYANKKGRKTTIIYNPHRY